MNKRTKVLYNCSEKKKPTPLIEDKGLPPVNQSRPMPPVKPPKKNKTIES